MLQRFVEEKLSISLCLNEKPFQKNLKKAKISSNIDWDFHEQLMVAILRNLSWQCLLSVGSRTVRSRYAEARSGVSAECLAASAGDCNPDHQSGNQSCRLNVDKANQGCSEMFH